MGRVQSEGALEAGNVRWLESGGAEGVREMESVSGLNPPSLAGGWQGQCDEEFRWPPGAETGPVDSQQGDGNLSPTTVC